MSQHTCLVSFIIATKKPGASLLCLLDSIRQVSDRSNYEIVLALSHASPEAISLLEGLSGILPIKIASYRDSGIYNAWNKALSAASGAWAVFLGDDDKIYDPDSAIMVFDFLASQISSNYDFVTFDAYLGPPAKRFCQPRYKYSQIWKGIKFFHPSSAIRLRCFADRKFCDHYQIISDYIFFSLHEFRHVYFPCVFVDIGQNGVSMSRRYRIVLELIDAHLRLYKNPLKIAYLPLLTILSIFKRSLFSMLHFD